MITGNEATLKVRDYFESVHGINGVIAFMVLTLNKNIAENEWDVSCTFYPSVGARQRVGYIVKVDSEDGSIKQAEMVVVKD
ncbi:MAG: hypothetical protein O8C63_05225 [Candidatus Methanoperedens sp.]|nr:hypothetical protein [Candidatus Methanoperedens sp.]